MGSNIERIIDIGGAILIIGLILRYGKEAAMLTASGESLLVHGTQAISLQTVTR